MLTCALDSCICQCSWEWRTENNLRSNVRVPLTARAAALRTRCQLSITVRFEAAAIWRCNSQCRTSRRPVMLVLGLGAWPWYLKAFANWHCVHPWPWVPMSLLISLTKACTSVAADSSRGNAWFVEVNASGKSMLRWCWSTYFSRLRSQISWNRMHRGPERHYLRRRCRHQAAKTGHGCPRAGKTPTGF